MKHIVHDQNMGTFPQRIDRYLRRLIPGLTQGVFEKSLRSKTILLNEKKIEASDRISPGDILTFPDAFNDIKRTIKKGDVLTHDVRKQIEQMILWEDDTFIILNKPFGLCVQGGSNSPENIDDWLKMYGASQRPAHFYHLVHRLDRDTSGVLLIAKTSAEAHRLGDFFKKHVIQKTYIAIVEGAPFEKKGCVDAPLIKRRISGEEKVVVSQEDGMNAQTRYQLLIRLPHHRSLIAFQPITGRTHQIRVHAQHIHCPILGDPKYNCYFRQGQRLHLHAYSITFPDIRGHGLTFRAPPSEHILDVLNTHGIDFDKISITP